ncbi:MAG: hypothetical protein ABI321_20345 [Polyangia bacterium]
MALLSVIAPFVVGCSDTTDYYFDGRVYDGQTGVALTAYKIQLQYLDRKDSGHVDKQGRYFLGPLPPFNDYGVSIAADGYRPFLSQNTMKLDDEQTMNDNVHDDKSHPDRSQYFDAYLFSTTATTSAATLKVTLSDSTTAAAGSIRLRPISSNSPFGAADTSSQVWNNDDDLRGPAITKTFTSGSIALAAGELDYGVTYAITIDVDGYQELLSTYTAGVQADTTFVVSRSGTPLALVYSTTDSGLPTRSGAVVLGFNKALTLTSAVRSDVVLRAVGDKLSLTRATVDASEGPVTYSDLDGITVRSADSDTDVLLSSLVGATSLTVAVTP